MGRIFISHIEKGASILKQIAQGLDAAGYPTWCFDRDVFSGASYLIRMTKAIEQCNAIVLIPSPSAPRPGQVTIEVVGAFEQHKAFFPVPIDITPPELKESFGRDYMLYDDPYLGQLIDRLAPEQNPLERHNKVMASSDLAKREGVRAQPERRDNGQEKKAIRVIVQ